MARSKSPARAKPKSPAKKPAAKAIPVKSAFFDVSFITNDEVSLAPAFGMPLMLTAFFYALYAIDCMGFLVTDTNFMPAFKLANWTNDDAALKYYGEAITNEPTKGFCIGFGVLMFLNVQTMYYMAHNKDKSVTCAFVYGKAVQAFMAFLVTAFIGSAATNSTGPFVSNQYKAALVLNLVLGFVLQNSMRGVPMKTLPKFDIGKHGSVGYFLFFNYAISFVYMLTMIFDDPYKRYGNKVEEVTGSGAYAFAHYFALMLAFQLGDLQFFFEYGSERNVEHCAKFCIWRAICVATWLNETKASWDEMEQITAIALQTAIIVVGIGVLAFP